MKASRDSDERGATVSRSADSAYVGAAGHIRRSAVCEGNVSNLTLWTLD